VLSWETAKVDRHRVSADPAVVLSWEPVSAKGHKRVESVHFETCESKPASGRPAETLTLRIGDVGVRVTDDGHREAVPSAGLHLFQEISTLGQQLEHTLLLR